jgi:hypothetical protein
VTSVVYDLEIIAAVITNLNERIDLFADFGMTLLVGNLKFLYVVVVSAVQEFVEDADLLLNGQPWILGLP